MRNLWDFSSRPTGLARIFTYHITIIHYHNDYTWPTTYRIFPISQHILSFLLLLCIFTLSPIFFLLHTLSFTSYFFATPILSFSFIFPLFLFYFISPINCALHFTPYFILFREERKNRVYNSSPFSRQNLPYFTWRKTFRPFSYY